jgi:hypothetical protein
MTGARGRSAPVTVANVDPDSRTADAAPSGMSTAATLTAYSTAHFPAIGDLAFLSDGEVAALVAPTGNVEWLCLPAIDSPSVFGTLLDRGAGRFRVAPAGSTVPAGQRYLLASMVVETTWMTATGLLMVRDALAPRRGDTPSVRARSCGRRRHAGGPRAGANASGAFTGAVDVVVECEPMFDYGAVPARWGLTARATTTQSHAAPSTHRIASRHELRLGSRGVRAPDRRGRESERAFAALTGATGVAPSSVDEAFAAVDATSNHWRRRVGGGSFPTTVEQSISIAALTLRRLPTPERRSRGARPSAAAALRSPELGLRYSFRPRVRVGTSCARSGSRGRPTTFSSFRSTRPRTTVLCRNFSRERR